MNLPSLELGYTSARHTAAMLVATIKDQEPVAELQRVLNACMPDAIQCSRLVLTAIRKADFADQWKLVAYALAYHGLPAKEHGEEMVALGMTQSEIERQIERVHDALKEVAESILDTMASLETAARRIWQLINRFESESTQVVILAACLHRLRLTPYVEFSGLGVSDESYRAFADKHPEFLDEIMIILNFPSQKTARMQAAEALISSLPEEDRVIARGHLLGIIERRRGGGLGSILGQILGQLPGFGDGGIDIRFE